MAGLLLTVPGALSPAGPAAAAFDIQTVDSTFAACGYNSAIALDAQDVPHLSWFDTDPSLGVWAGPLRSARLGPGGWVTTPVDTTPSATAPSLAIDSHGSEHLGYARSIVIGVGTELKYAHWTGSNWTNQVIASGADVSTSMSLALDPADRPHVCYQANGWIHAVLEGGSWHTEAIPTESYATGGFLRLTSAGVPEVVMMTGFPTVVKLLTRQANGSWTTEVVDNANNLVATHMSFVLDAHDHPHLGYWDYNHGVAKYAYRSDAGWVVETLPFTGTSLALAVGPDGTVRVVYTTQSPRYPNPMKLWLATRAGGTWTRRVVEASTAVIGSAAIAVDASGDPHISYQFGTGPYVSFALHYARSVPDSPPRTLRVPADVATIQGAVDAARDADTVQVSPGTYTENLDFRGKAIVVRSERGPELTVVDGGGTAPVATFATDETPSSVLQGFTLRNGLGGYPAPHDGGGVQIVYASPSIVGNVIAENRSSSGAGIDIYFGSPRIDGNTIRDNHADNWGGGLELAGVDSAWIAGNRIVHNRATEGGGAIYINNASSAVIRDNVIEDNSAAGNGGALLMYNYANPLIAQNLVARNRSEQGYGGGFAWSIPYNASGPRVVNNTIVDNTAALPGSGVWSGGFDAGVLVENNVIAGSDSVCLFWSDPSYDTSPPIVRSNDVHSARGPAYGGAGGSQTGRNGNISVDPLFADRADGDYHLRPMSPCVDRGDNAAPGLTATDLDGAPRVFDGNHDGTATVDLGAFEFGLRADAGRDTTVECESADGHGTPVRLDGTASEGPGIQYAWSAPGVTFDDPASPTPTGRFPAGTTAVVLTVSLGAQVASDTVEVTVRDSRAPDLVVALGPAFLWPPNGRMIPIHATLTMTDACDPTPAFRLVSLVASEGAGTDDIEGVGVGTPDVDFSLRAERRGDGPGRFYTVCYEARDAAGNAVTRCARVTVPHDMGGRAQVRKGPRGAALTIFGSAALDVRSVPAGTVKVGQAGVDVASADGATARYGDADADGIEDVTFLLGATHGHAFDRAPMQYVRWQSGQHDYVAAIDGWAEGAADLEPAATFSASAAPNPGRGCATIRYVLPREGLVRLVVYDVTGRALAQLAAGVGSAGAHEVEFVGPATLGAQLYFYRLEWEGRSLTGKFVLVR